MKSQKTNLKLKQHNRIYIFGGTGSGKTTLAKKLSSLLKIPYFTTDEFIYKNNWSEKFTGKQRDTKLKKASNNKKWIFEGVHRGDWILPAFKKSELVIILNISRLILLKRALTRYIKRKLGFEKNPKKEKLTDILILIKYVWIYKNDNFIYPKNMVKKHKKNFIILYNKNHPNFIKTQI